jgi:hypothetical protein
MAMALQHASQVLLLNSAADVIIAQVIAQVFAKLFSMHAPFMSVKL